MHTNLSMNLYNKEGRIASALKNKFSYLNIGVSKVNRKTNPLQEKKWVSYGWLYQSTRGVPEN